MNEPRIHEAGARGARNPTLADVARRAGVSPATVSRCLNAPSSVRPDRRRRIEAAVEALGYLPHGAARALASRRSKMIGALLPRLDSLLFGSFIGPLQTQLAAQGYTLVVATHDYDETVELGQIRNLVSNGIDGLALVGARRLSEGYALLERARLPFVVTWVWSDASSHPQIGFSNARAAARAAHYLVDIGHRRIAMVSGPLTGNDRAGERARGVRDALAERGLPLGPGDLVEREFSVDEGARACRELMSRPEPPTAILCGSDVFAFGALFEAQRLGLSVPGSVSITGFDDTEIAACVSPSLTTIRTPRARMAELTAEYLLAAIGGAATPRSRQLSVELVLRESTAPPPDRRLA